MLTGPGSALDLADSDRRGPARLKRGSIYARTLIRGALVNGGQVIDGPGPTPTPHRSRASTPSSISSVSTPVCVFRWLTW